MPNFDYAIAVGICTLVVLLGLRGAMPWMRVARRKRTDELLVQINEPSDGEVERNEGVVTGVADPVATREENESKKTQTDG